MKIYKSFLIALFLYLFLFYINANAQNIPADVLASLERAVKNADDEVNLEDAEVTMKKILGQYLDLKYEYAGVLAWINYRRGKLSGIAELEEALSTLTFIKVYKNEPADKYLEMISRYHYYLGRIYIEQGVLELAKQHFKKVTQLSPDSERGMAADMILTRIEQGELSVSTKPRVTFKLQPIPGVTKVNLIGTFNNWDEKATPMILIDNVWQVTLELSPGRYTYKFVLNESMQAPDPSNPDMEDDGFGGEVSVINVKEEERKEWSQVTVNFKYDNPKAVSVSLVGSFNEWNKEANKLTQSQGKWQTTLKLFSGKYYYKLIVDDSRWVEDPKADFVKDPLGGKFSILEIKEDGSLITKSDSWSK